MIIQLKHNRRTFKFSPLPPGELRIGWQIPVYLTFQSGSEEQRTERGQVKSQGHAFPFQPGIFWHPGHCRPEAIMEETQIEQRSTVPASRSFCSAQEGESDPPGTEPRSTLWRVPSGASGSGRKSRQMKDGWHDLSTQVCHVWGPETFFPVRPRSLFSSVLKKQ
jgi:hypothetical protein